MAIGGQKTGGASQGGGGTRNFETVGGLEGGGRFIESVKVGNEPTKIKAPLGKSEERMSELLDNSISTVSHATPHGILEFAIDPPGAFDPDRAFSALAKFDETPPRFPDLIKQAERLPSDGDKNVQDPSVLQENQTNEPKNHFGQPN